MSNVDKSCTTHFHACDCRERHFEQLERDNCKLAKKNQQLYQGFDGLEKAVLRMAKENKLLRMIVCIFESSDDDGFVYLHSIHKTKKGAEKAMAESKKEYGEDNGQDWHVYEKELLE